MYLTELDTVILQFLSGWGLDLLRLHAQHLRRGCRHLPFPLGHLPFLSVDCEISISTIQN